MSTVSATVRMTMVTRSLGTAVVKPHVPMIKFRKGGIQTASAPPPADPAPAAASASGPAVYEWWEIPGKFRRPVIDQSECDVINMGGGDKLW